MVEYRHSDGFQWGYDVINGTSNYLSGVSFNSVDPLSNISLNFDITQRLKESFKLNLQALVSKNLAVISQNPRITVKDGQTASINIVEDRYVQLQTASQNGLTTNLEKISAGVKLNITPKTITNGKISLNVDGSLSDFLITSDNSSTYAIETSKIQTKVDLDLGQTLIIGGLLAEKTRKTKGGIPLLKSIPLIGWLFSSVNNVSEVIETVIYISVYKQGNLESNNSNNLINKESPKINELKNKF